MNEQARKVLADLLKKASDGIDSAVVFSQQQMPDVIHQLLMWNIVSSALVQVLCVFIIAFSIVMIVKAWGTDDFDNVMAAGMVFGIAIFITIVVFFNHFDWLKIWISPKLYLIEYAAKLIK